MNFLFEFSRYGMNEQYINENSLFLNKKYNVVSEHFVIKTLDVTPLLQTQKGKKCKMHHTFKSYIR